MSTPNFVFQADDGGKAIIKANAFMTIRYRNAGEIIAAQEIRYWIDSLSHRRLDNMNRVFEGETEIRAFEKKG